MDQNDVPMQTNVNSGYQYMPNVAYNPASHVSIDSGSEYTPNVPAYSPQMVNYQYGGDMIQPYSNTETIDPSMTGECNMPNNYEFVPNYLAPANFYGNQSYAPSQYQKVEDNYGYGHYGQDITTEANVYSHPTDVPVYSEPAQETVSESKPMIIDEVCVEEAKVEIKSDEPRQAKESESFVQPEVEQPTVPVHHDEEPQPEEKVKPHEVERAQVKQEIRDSCDFEASEASQNVPNPESERISDENIKQNTENGSTPAEAASQSIQMCIRSGCANEAVNNPEWEQEFCSNECVILHCKNVFTAWVQSNQAVAT